MVFKKRLQVVVTGEDRKYFEEQKKRLKLDHDAKALRMMLREHKNLVK